MEQGRTGAASPAAGGVRGDVAFLRRVLIVAAVLVLMLLLWQVREALLLTFAGVLVAVLLLACAEPLEARLGLSRTLSLLATRCVTETLYTPGLTSPSNPCRWKALVPRRAKRRVMPATTLPAETKSVPLAIFCLRLFSLTMALHKTMCQPLLVKGRSPTGARLLLTAGSHSVWPTAR